MDHKSFSPEMIVFFGILRKLSDLYKFCALLRAKSVT